MAFGVTFMILAVVIIAIWLIIEAKRLRHKFVAIFLILLIIFTYVSFSVVIKNNDLNLKTTSGWISAGKLYFIWLGGIFKNVKSVTAYAFKQDWRNIEKSTLDKKTENSKEVNEDSIWNSLQDI